MPGWGHHMTWDEQKPIINAIDDHYRRRGVPETKLFEMRCRWLATKGWRCPK